MSNIAKLDAKASSLVLSESHDQSKVLNQLQCAINSNAINDLETLLNDSTLVNKPLPNREMPLNYAIRLGRYELVQKIVSKNATGLDSVDSHGLTPVDHAFLAKDNKMIGIILGCKLGVDHTNVTEFFSKASSKCKKELAFVHSVAERCTPQTTSLHGAFEAAFKGDLGVISSLIETLDVNTTTVNGWSLLHLAAKSGNAELVKLLLDKGARTDFVTSDGISPLHVAAAGNNRKIIQHLLNARADLKATDKQGSTPLHFAMTNNNLFSAQLLIENKADFSQANQLGISPISVMAAMARVQSQDKDELKLDRMQALMFAGIAASYLHTYLANNTIEGIDPSLISSVALTAYAVSHAASLVPLATAFMQTKTLVGRAVYLGTMGLSFIPGVNIAAQAWKTYAVGQRAWKSLETAWSYRHIETTRPLRNALISGTNAVYSCDQLNNSINYTINFVTETIEAIKTSWLGDALEHTKDPIAAVMQFPQYWADSQERLKDSDCMKRVRDLTICFYPFYQNEIDRFKTEGLFSFEASKFGPETCGSHLVNDPNSYQATLATCIQENNLDPTRKHHTEAILGISLQAATVKKCQEAFRALTLKYHSDKSSEGLADKTTMAIRTAKETCTQYATE